MLRLSKETRKVGQYRYERKSYRITSSKRALKKTSVKEPLPTVAKTVTPRHQIDVDVEGLIKDLPYIEDVFRIIPCSRQKASAIQRRLYALNKDNAAGIVYATRYNYQKNHLLMWRMA